MAVPYPVGRKGLFFRAISINYPRLLKKAITLVIQLSLCKLCSFSTYQHGQWTYKSSHSCIENIQKGILGWLVVQHHSQRFRLDIRPYCGIHSCMCPVSLQNKWEGHTAKKRQDSYVHAYMFVQDCKSKRLQRNVDPYSSITLYTCFVQSCKYVVEECAKFLL